MRDDDKKAIDAVLTALHGSPGLRLDHEYEAAVAALHSLGWIAPYEYGRETPSPRAHGSVWLRAEHFLEQFGDVDAPHVHLIRELHEARSTFITLTKRFCKERDELRAKLQENSK